MKLKEKAPVTSLARRLGIPAHVSGLAIRLARSSGGRDRLPEWLLPTVAERFAPTLEPWAFLRQHLPARLVPRLDALPHWTRLVSHTGVTGHGDRPRTDWLCRDE